LDPSDTNYIFLYFVVNVLPAGVIGLVIACILAASMSSTASELNALASTTVVDIYKRISGNKENGHHDIRISRLATIGWGIYAIFTSIFASRLGSLIEAVNILARFSMERYWDIFSGFLFKKGYCVSGLYQRHNGRGCRSCLFPFYGDLFFVVQRDRLPAGTTALACRYVFTGRSEIPSSK